MTKVEKPDWMKLKDLHDAEEIEVGQGFKRPRSRGATYGPEESLVDQVGDGYTNVNDIMKRFERMPTAEELQAAGFAAGGFYGDFIGAPDFEQALQISNAGKAQFALLPASWRAHFNHDPKEFLAFVMDPANGDKLIEMGLRKPKPPEEKPQTRKDDTSSVSKPSPKGKATPPRQPASEGEGEGND